MMINSTYEFEGGSIRPINNHVLWVTFDGGQKVTRAICESAYHTKLDLIGGNAHASILEFKGGFGKLSAEAKTMILTHIDPFDKNFVTVLMAKNSFEKIEISIFMKLHPSSDNIVIAKSKDEALKAIKKAREAASQVDLAG